MTTIDHETSGVGSSAPLTTPPPMRSSAIATWWKGRSTGSKVMIALIAGATAVVMLFGGALSVAMSRFGSPRDPKSRTV